MSLSFKPSRTLAAAAALALAASAVPASAETSFFTLGTQGGPVTSTQRGQPSNLLVVNGMRTLVDVGDGTAQRLATLKIPTAIIDNILITHLHYDHMAGLQGILGLRFQTNSPKPVQVYGPPGTDVMVRGLLASMAPSMEAGYGVPGQKSYTADELVAVHVVRAGEAFQLGDTKVTATGNSHYSFPANSPETGKFQSLSYRFDTPDKVIAFTGDTGPSKDVEKLSQGADLFIGEMIDVALTVSEIQRIDPHLPAPRLEGMKIHLAKHHLTPVDLGEMAARAGAKALVVTHLVPGGAMTPQHIEAYTKEIATKFSGKITFANVMDKF